MLVVVEIGDSVAIAAVGVEGPAAVAGGEHLGFGGIKALYSLDLDLLG